MSTLVTNLKVLSASILSLARSNARYQHVATKLDERAYSPIFLNHLAEKQYQRRMADEICWDEK